MMKERPIVKERVDWWQAGFGVILFAAGLDIASQNLIIGGLGIALGLWLTVDSKKQVAVAS